ncbi:hypothetical protein ACFW9M_14190 [Streptomyces lydicus]
MNVSSGLSVRVLAVGPALAVFGGKLYCAYKGTGNNNPWWCSTGNGTR